jgi:segregation and condensation protein A
VSSPLDLHLEHYEGPLDLLLDLIRKQQIDIKDIPIATITSQYLEYMEKAREMDIDLGAEFVYMAATLIHIKSKMLLPRDPALGEDADQADDPRQELVERLLEHERFKNAAEMLQQKRMIEENVWSNPQIQQFLSGEEEPELAVTLFDLVKTFEQVLERAKSRPVFQVNHEDVGVPDMVLYLRSLILSKPRGEKIPAAELFEAQRSRRAMICLFLAILEMVKMQALVLVQKDAFGEIAVRAHKRFDEAFASDEAVTNIEKDYQ